MGTRDLVESHGKSESQMRLAGPNPLKTLMLDHACACPILIMLSRLDAVSNNVVYVLFAQHLQRTTLAIGQLSRDRSGTSRSFASLSRATYQVPALRHPDIIRPARGEASRILP